MLVGFIIGNEGVISHHFDRLFRSHNLTGVGIHGELVGYVSRVYQWRVRGDIASFLQVAPVT